MADPIAPVVTEIPPIVEPIVSVQEKVFPEDYVKNLREENKAHRLKNDALEASIKADKHSQSVNVELIKKGIKVDPKFIDIKENETIGQAVDRFVKENPGFGSVNPVDTDKTLSPDANLKNDKDYGDMTIDEIRSDPEARSRLVNEFNDALNHSTSKSVAIERLKKRREPKLKGK